MTPMSNGSGFIVRKDGLILTNAHVVGNHSNVRVRLQDGRTFDGTVQAVDPISDLATVKVSAVDYLDNKHLYLVESVEFISWSYTATIL